MHFDINPHDESMNEAILEKRRITLTFPNRFQYQAFTLGPFKKYIHPEGEGVCQSRTIRIKLSYFVFKKRARDRWQDLTFLSERTF